MSPDWIPRVRSCERIARIGEAAQAATDASRLPALVLQASDDFEDDLLPLAELAHKVADGDQFFGHDLRPGGLILTKPSQDPGEHQTELIRLEHPQLSHGSHVRIR